MMADIDISGESCGVQIKWLLQKGYSDIITKRGEAAMADRLGAMRGPSESYSEVILRMARANS